MAEAEKLEGARVFEHGDPWGRQSGDDFFCIRYQVWYSSFDCALRTKFSTCEGCFNCDQGRFNFRRHATALRDVRFSVTAGE